MDIEQARTKLHHFSKVGDAPMLPDSKCRSCRKRRLLELMRLWRPIVSRTYWSAKWGRSIPLRNQPFRGCGCQRNAFLIFQRRTLYGRRLVQYEVKALHDNRSTALQPTFWGFHKRQQRVAGRVIGWFQSRHQPNIRRRGSPKLCSRWLMQHGSTCKGTCRSRWS